jgi:hypothetical protein
MDTDPHYRVITDYTIWLTFFSVMLIQYFGTLSFYECFMPYFGLITLILADTCISLKSPQPKLVFIPLNEIITV